MSYAFRVAVPNDVEACIAIRGLTRENAISASELAARGITLETWSRDIETGTLPGYVCTMQGHIVGYCFGQYETGEVVVLALLPDHESQGLGRALLRTVVEDFRARGFKRVFLECSTDPSARSFGFYRHLGWRPTGTQVAHDDEVLELVLAA